MRFQGTQVFITGGVLNGSTYPEATYSIDDSSAGTQQPFYDNTSGIVYYFQSPQLSATTHTLFMNVTQASNQSLFILDAVWYVPLSGASAPGTVTVIPSNTALSNTGHSTTNVGAIAGGVVGGVAGLVVLALAAYFLMRRRRRRAYYFEKPNVEDMLDTGKFASMLNKVCRLDAFSSLQRYNHPSKTCSIHPVMVFPLGIPQCPLTQAQIQCILLNPAKP
jgi:hypothetical protein